LTKETIIFDWPFFKKTNVTLPFRENSSALTFVQAASSSFLYQNN